MKTVEQKPQVLIPNNMTGETIRSSPATPHTHVLIEHGHHYNSDSTLWLLLLLLLPAHCCSLLLLTSCGGCMLSSLPSAGRKRGTLMVWGPAPYSASRWLLCCSIASTSYLLTNKACVCVLTLALIRKERD